MTDPRKNSRDVFPTTGSKLTAKSWLTEAPMRMLMNNLHPDVVENPHELLSMAASDGRRLLGQILTRL